MPDMKKKYVEEVRAALQSKLELKNVMQIPKLQKIVTLQITTVHLFTLQTQGNG